MGLLARAEEYLQHEAEMRIAAEQRAAEEQMALAAAIKARPSKTEMIKNTASKIANGAKVAKSKLTHLATDFQAKFQTAIKKAYQPQLHRLAATVFALGLSLQTVQPTTLNHHNMALQQWTNWNITPAVEQTVEPRPAQPESDAFFDVFEDLHKMHFSEQDIDDLARLIKGEAGKSIEERCEIMHVIFNRLESPLFHGNLHDIITAKNQFEGWENNQNAKVDENDKRFVKWFLNVNQQKHACAHKCNHYYFVTDIKGVCNKFEISPAAEVDPQGALGKWIAPQNKKYTETAHYCADAVHEAQEYKQWLAEQNSTVNTQSFTL